MSLFVSLRDGGYDLIEVVGALVGLAKQPQPCQLVGGEAHNGREHYCCKGDIPHRVVDDLKYADGKGYLPGAEVALVFFSRGLKTVLFKASSEGVNGAAAAVEHAEVPGTAGAELAHILVKDLRPLVDELTYAGGYGLVFIGGDGLAAFLLLDVVHEYKLCRKVVADVIVCALFKALAAGVGHLSYLLAHYLGENEVYKVDDAAAAAVVALELHKGGGLCACAVGSLFLGLDEQRRVGEAEAVNGLLYVPHHKGIKPQHGDILRLGERLEDKLLNVVYVLKLVDKYYAVLPAGDQLFAEGGALYPAILAFHKQPQRHYLHVGEFQRIAPKLFFIGQLLCGEAIAVQRFQHIGGELHGSFEVGAQLFSFFKYLLKLLFAVVSDISDEGKELCVLGGEGALLRGPLLEGGELRSGAGEYFLPAAIL